MSTASKQETDRLTHQLVSRVNLSSSSPELLALSTQYQSPGVGLVLPSITISEDGLPSVSEDGLLEEWLCVHLWRDRCQEVEPGWLCLPK